MGKTNRISIDDAKFIAKLALKEHDEEMEEKKKQKVLYDTKLLLKHFNDLKKHVDNAVCSTHDLEVLEDIEDIEDLECIDDYDYEDVYISSIMRTKNRTRVMVRHIEICLKQLKEKKMREGNLDQYRALELYYIEGHSYEQLQSDLNCGKNTPARWINAAIKDLSVLLFGVDALKLDGLV